MAYAISTNASDGGGGGASEKHFTVIGWALIALALYALNGTKLGHEVIFYALVLIILYLFSANYQNIISLIQK